MANIFAFITGLIFGFGLALSGMTHPEKVLGFLDVAGQWDASLLFVLCGAVGVTVISFRFITKLDAPVFAPIFRLPESNAIDKPLLIGSALFGTGWGISGYCPGPAVALLASPNRELWIFLPAMLLGYVLHWYLFKPQAQKSAAVTPENTKTEQPTCG